MVPKNRSATALLLALFLGMPVANQAGALDLSKALVLTPANLSVPEKKAVSMLLDEVEKRSQIRWTSARELPADRLPVIAVGQCSALKQFADATEPGDELVSEGYRVRVQNAPDRQVVLVAGNDSRGVLFGVGRLLRELHMAPDHVTIDDQFSVSSAPKYRLRGHQLGYRPKTHSYDAWDLAVWEQYIRDLAVFGCNVVELIPPRSDDEATSPHFPLPPMQMMIGMSKLLDDYGLDVWVWYPAMDKDYSDPKTVEFALKEWGDAFRQLS